MQVTFETRARSAAHFCPFVKPFSEKFVGDFVKNESLSPVFSRDRDSERLFFCWEDTMTDLYFKMKIIAWAAKVPLVIIIAVCCLIAFIIDKRR